MRLKGPPLLLISSIWEFWGPLMKATFDCLTLRSNRTYLLCIHIYIYICVCVCIYVRTSGHGGDGGDGDGGGGDGGDGGDDGGFSFPHLLSSPVSPRRGITWPKTWISFSLSICLSIYLFFLSFFFRWTRIWNTFRDRVGSKFWRREGRRDPFEKGGEGGENLTSRISKDEKRKPKKNGEDKTIEREREEKKTQSKVRKKMTLRSPVSNINDDNNRSLRIQKERIIE